MVSPSNDTRSVRRGRGAPGVATRELPPMVTRAIPRPPRLDTVTVVTLGSLVCTPTARLKPPGT